MLPHPLDRLFFFICVSWIKFESIILPNIPKSFNTLFDFFFFRDPFSAHRQQMRAMFGPFGLDPFAVTPHMQPHRAPRRQVAALCRFSRSLSIKQKTWNNTDFVQSFSGWSSGSLWHDGNGEWLRYQLVYFFALTVLWCYRWVIYKWRKFLSY